MKNERIKGRATGGIHRMRRDYENLFNYVNLNLFSNRFGVILCDFQRTGKKVQDLQELCATMKDLLDKYKHWSPEPRYSSFVNRLLQSEEEYQLLAQSFEDLDGKSKARSKGFEKVIETLLQNIDQVEKTDRVTKPINGAIDYLVDFLTILSDYTIISQDFDNSHPYGKDKAVSVLLR